MATGFYTFAISTSVIVGSLFSLFTLQSSVEVKGNVGLMSLGAYYGMAVVSACIVYPFLLRLIGRKYNLILGDASCIVFGLIFLHPVPEAAIAISALLGVFESSLWAAAFAIAATYKTSGVDTDHSNGDPASVGKFIALTGLGQALMNLIPELALRSTNVANNAINLNISALCGARDCPGRYSGNDSQGILENLIPSQTSLYILIGTIATFQTGVLIIHLLCIPNEDPKCGEEATLLPSRLYEEGNDGKSARFAVSSALVHLKDSLRAMLRNGTSPISIFTLPSQLHLGLISGFLWSEFTRSYVSCTLGVQNVGLCMFIANLMSATMSMVTARFKQYISMRTLSFIILSVELVTTALAIFWIPSTDTLYVPHILAMLFGGCFGLARSLSAFIPVAYFRDIDSAYALGECWTSLGIMASQILSKELCTMYVLSVICSFSIYSTCSLMVGDYKFGRIKY